MVEKGETLTEGNELLDAYQALAQPRKVVYEQVNAAGIGCRSEVVLESLIAQLRAAIVGGIGSKGAAGDGKARLPFDAGALAIYDEIEDTSVAWLLEVDRRPPYESPEANLAAWYLAYSRMPNPAGVDPAGEAREREWVRRLRGWATRVQAMFDPPTRREVTESWREPIVDAFGVQRTKRKRVLEVVDGVPTARYVQEPQFRVTTRPARCPHCGERWAFNRDTGDRISALVMEFRLADEHDAEAGVVATFRSIEAACRFCTRRWEGRDGVRAMESAIDEHRAAEENEQTRGQA